MNNAGGPRHITLDFVDAEISDVAKALSVQSGVNIVVSPNAKVRTGFAGREPPGRRFSPWKCGTPGSPSNPRTVGATSVRLAG